MEVERLMTAATHYVDRGWFVFTVSEDKIPWGNCGRCPPGAHDGSACPGGCLRCHGHLAATRDLDRLRAMIWGSGGRCALALDCGRSGLVVVDAEGDDRGGHGVTGLGVLEQYEAWTGGRSLPVCGLRAVTGGGGLHLFYAGHAVSGNRVLPNVDLKAGGGYVVCPPAAGRRWLDWPGELVAWDPGALPPGGAGGGDGAGGTGSRGVALKDRLVDGMVPGGARYEYVRDLVYKLRKRGVTREEAERVCLEEYGRLTQPPVAASVLPWSQMLYELDRVWARVEPERMSPGHQMWMRGRTI